MRYFKTFLFSAGLSILLSCTSSNNILQQWQNLPQMPGRLGIQLPFNHTLFPADMAPTTVRWQDSTNARSWFIVVSQAQKQVMFSQQTKSSSWQPDSLLWEQIKQNSQTEPMQVSVLGLNKGKIISGAEIQIRTSADSVNASIFYRAVPLPFEYAIHHFEEIRWHLGDISSAKPAPALLKNLPLCGNCHSFTRDGRTLAMDVDYANDKGSYVVSDIDNKTVLTPDKIITWSNYRPQDGEKTYGLLSQISPDGRYVASTVKDRSIFVATEGLHYSQLFFPIKGIIAIYDRKTDTFFALPGANDPDYVQSNPTWSPDGKYLYFCKERAYTSQAIEQSKDVILSPELAQEFIDGKRDFKYDIYRIPFNEGRGGQAEPLPGASNNGKSNFFPRLSPNGKWLVFSQADNFMLLQPDSKLMILPADGGEPRLLACNTDSMNSWHSWSPNSKWLVFSSKLRGPYTELLLTHIDEQGHSSPPVLLENLSFENYAANIPEFVNLGNRSWETIADEFSQQAHYYFTIGRSKLGDKKIQEALDAFDRAIALDPTYAKSYVLKGHVYLANDQYEPAYENYKKAADYIKDDAELYQNLGTACYKLQKYNEAIHAFDRSIALDSQNAKAYLGRALARAKSDLIREAMQDFDRAIELDPEAARTYHERGVCHAILQNWDQAIQDLQQASKLDPNNQDTFEKLGSCYYHLQQFNRAEEAYTFAIQINNENYKFYEYRGDSRYKQQNLQGALDDYSAAINAQPRAGTSYYRRGVVHLQMGDKSAGCNDLLMAQQLGIREAQEMLRQHCQN